MASKKRCSEETDYPEANKDWDARIPYKVIQSWIESRAVTPEIAKALVAFQSRDVSSSTDPLHIDVRSAVLPCTWEHFLFIDKQKIQLAFAIDVEQLKLFQKEFEGQRYKMTVHQVTTWIWTFEFEKCVYITDLRGYTNYRLILASFGTLRFEVEDVPRGWLPPQNEICDEFSKLVELIPPKARREITNRDLLHCRSDCTSFHSTACANLLRVGLDHHKHHKFCKENKPCDFKPATPVSTKRVALSIDGVEVLKSTIETLAWRPLPADEHKESENPVE